MKRVTDSEEVEIRMVSVRQRVLLQIQNLKSLLNNKFEMKDMGVAENILSIEIKRDQVQKKLFLYQKK